MQFIIFFQKHFSGTESKLAYHALGDGPALRNTDYGSEFFRAVINEAN